MAAVRLTTFRSLGRSPLPTWAIALLAGQALAASGARTLDVWLSPVACGAALCLPARRWRSILTLLLLLVGASQVENRRAPPPEEDHVAAHANGAATLRAAIIERNERERGALRLVLDVEAMHDGDRWLAAHGLVQLTIAEPTRDWESGARVELTAWLKRPRNFGNPGEFDYEAFLARRGIFVTGFARDDREIVVVERPPPSWIDSWRRRVRDQLARLEPPAREILAALILGEMGALPERTRGEFAAAGVSHVLSISGLHVAMVAGAGFAAFRWLLARSRWLLLRTRVPLLAAAFSLVPVCLYAELAQAGVATWRSLVMLLLVVAAVLAQRDADLCVSLAAAALVAGAIWPGVLLDVSFQLSFVSVLALVLAMERYWRWWSAYSEARLFHLRGRRFRWLGLALASLAVNIAALVATAPLTAFHFNQVSPISLIANPLIVPLLGTAAVALGLAAALATSVSSTAAHAIFVVAGAFTDLGAWLTSIMAALPGAGLRVVTPSLLELTLFYAIAAVAILGRDRSRRWMLFALLIIAAVDLSIAARQRWFRTVPRVTFLSVGQGASAVIELPGSAVMVVDGGGLRGFDTGERLVAPYLWQRKIAAIDYLVLTHPDFDHYGGLGFLAANFSPREFWHSGATSESHSYAELLAAVRDSGAREVVVAAGESRRISHCGVDVLWPPSTGAGLGENDMSVVLRLDCGGVSVLLPGDLEAAGEAGLLASGAALRSSVLAAGHHGSRTSSTAAFVDAVRPDMAVISAGYRNRFGFPDRGVERRLAESGAIVRRTDLDGAVVLELEKACAAAQPPASTVVDSP